MTHELIKNKEQKRKSRVRVRKRDPSILLMRPDGEHGSRLISAVPGRVVAAAVDGQSIDRSSIRARQNGFGAAVRNKPHTK